MNYAPNDRRLNHDGAAICERLDRIIELLEEATHPLIVVRESSADYQCEKENGT